MDAESLQTEYDTRAAAPSDYIKSRAKGVATIGVGVVGGWFAGLAVNKVFRQGRGISAERIEQFAGPFKKHLKGLQENDVLLYETVGSMVGGAGAAIYRGYGGWKRGREDSADLREIKEQVRANHTLLNVPRESLETPPDTQILAESGEYVDAVNTAERTRL